MAGSFKITEEMMTAADTLNMIEFTNEIKTYNDYMAKLLSSWNTASVAEFKKKVTIDITADMNALRKRISEAVQMITSTKTEFDKRISEAAKNLKF